MLAFIFPGQGSQAVGMGQAIAEAFPAARQVFEEINDTLQQNLSALMFNGSEAELNLTANAQPALMATSMAIFKVLEQELKLNLPQQVAYMAGHSLGEYSALAAARTISVADCARLLKRRGNAMQNAVPVGMGAMAALLGADVALAEAIAREAEQGDVCAVGNDNAPWQVVLSGTRAAIARAIELAKQQGVKRCVELPVTVPSHCSLMAPAADQMAEAVAEITFYPPVVPIVPNVQATAETDPDELRRLLVEQIVHTVRWRESVLWMAAQGVTTFVEIGSGKVLASLNKRIAPETTTFSVEKPADIDMLAKFLSQTTIPTKKVSNV